MPVFTASTYKPTPFLFNGHLETIIPSAFRKIENVSYTRERLEIPDGDFLDLDWLKGHGKKLVIITHGLEGSSARHYVKGMAKYFHHNGWDALAWNCRGCSGEINRMPRLYHHAATEDLGYVIDHVLSTTQYDSIALVGFSMGGSLSMKYLGENAGALSSRIKSAAVFSVPCDLRSSAQALDQASMSFYRKRFIKKIEIKLRQKSVQFPETFRLEGFEKIRYFEELDERYTAPLHGFKNALDFYDKASARHYLPSITIPVLIVNAVNDPFLTPACSPRELAYRHAYVYLETPRRGGHVGFPLYNKEENWMETRAFQFVTDMV